MPRHRKRKRIGKQKRFTIQLQRGVPRWQYEVSFRGRFQEREWVWSYNDVVTFCKHPANVKAFMNSTWRKGVAYYQVLLYTLTGEYIHMSRRKRDHEYVAPPRGKDLDGVPPSELQKWREGGIDHSTPYKYKQLLKWKIRQFLRWTQM